MPPYTINVMEEESWGKSPLLTQTASLNNLSLTFYNSYQSEDRKSITFRYLKKTVIP